MKLIQKREVSKLESYFSGSDKLISRFSIWINRIKYFQFIALSGFIVSLSSCAGTSGLSGSSGEGGGKRSGSVLPWQSGTLKVGYIRSDIINRDYPEYRDADNELQHQNRKWIQEADKLEKLILKKEREHEELSLILSEEKRLEIETEIKTKRKELQKFKNDTWYTDNSSYVQRRREVMEPIDARVNDAIWIVAEQKGLDMVFDTIAGNVVYVKPSLDITEDVLEELSR